MIEAEQRAPRLARSRKLEASRGDFAVRLADPPARKVDIQREITASRPRQIAIRTRYGGEQLTPAGKHQPPPLKAHRSTQPCGSLQVTVETQHQARRASQPLGQKDEAVATPRAQLRPTQRRPSNLQH